MANLLQTLIPILFLLASAAVAVPPSSTSFFYDFSYPPISTGLTFQGDTHFLLGSSFLRLTSAEDNAVGRVLYTNPVQFWQHGGQVDFETTFTFLITPNEGKSPADGLVFFIAPVGSTPPNGGGGGNFGVFDASGNGPEVFAVEFDTFVNEWDPSDRHIGIDIGSSRSIITEDVGDAILGKKVTATISYAAATRLISVVVSVGDETFELSYEYDLSGFLTKQVQVGLSATTGQEMASHDIYSWYFVSKMVSTGAAPSAKSRKQLIRQFV